MHRGHLSSRQCVYQTATGRCSEATTNGRVLSNQPIRTVLLPNLTRRSWDADVVGVGGRWVVGLPRIGLIGLEPAFAILEIQQEHDGSEERVVHRNASRESTACIRVAFSLELKNRSCLLLCWIVGEIRIHARPGDPPSRYPVGKLRHRSTAKRTDYLHDRLWILETVHRPEDESAYTRQ